MRTTQRQVDAASGRRTGGAAWLATVWVGFVVAALLLLPVVPLTAWGVALPVGAALLLATTAWTARTTAWVRWRVDAADLVALAVLYALAVGCFRLAFGVFTTGSVAGLFLTFAAGLVSGVAGPVAYTVWIRRRPLGTLGLGLHALGPTLALAALLGSVQFTVMFWGRALPAPVDWVPLLVMSLTVGLFEAVFFRGFAQGRLEASFGIGPAVAGAALLYALYHVGYGMAAGELVFLFGLGVVYAIAYRLVENILVVWPLLTPGGAFFSNLQAGDIELPWASIAGFGDVLAVMALVIWLAARHERRRRPTSATAST